MDELEDMMMYAKKIIWKFDLIHSFCELTMVWHANGPKYIYELAYTLLTFPASASAKNSRKDVGVNSG